MPKRTSGRTLFLRSFPAVIAIAYFLSGASPPVPQEIGDSEGFLAGILLKNLALKERIFSDVQVSDRELHTSERIFLEAENRMTIATETHNTQAAWDAREPLKKARSDWNKLKQARARLDQSRARAEAAFAAARSMILSGKGTDIPVCGLVSLHAGKAKVITKNGNTVSLDAGRPRFLEPGEEIVTAASSPADVQILNGRATILLGERSRLRLEEDDLQSQKLRLVQGKIYSIVDKPEEFAGLFQEGRFNLGADPKLEEAVAKTRDRAQALVEKQSSLRTPSACLVVTNAKFAVGLIKGGAAEITVLEGTVEAGDAECSRRVPVEEGFKAVASKDGVSGPKKAADIDKWWEK